MALQIVFHYRVTGSYAVFPIDLFVFCISPTAVGNAHLVDPTPHSSLAAISGSTPKRPFAAIDRVINHLVDI
jgi:hypothetical protein